MWRVWHIHSRHVLSIISNLNCKLISGQLHFWNVNQNWNSWHSHRNVTNFASLSDCPASMYQITIVVGAVGGHSAHCVQNTQNFSSKYLSNWVSPKSVKRKTFHLFAKRQILTYIILHICVETLREFFFFCGWEKLLTWTGLAIQDALCAPFFVTRLAGHLELRVTCEALCTLSSASSAANHPHGDLSPNGDAVAFCAKL